MELEADVIDRIAEGSDRSPVVQCISQKRRGLGEAITDCIRETGLEQESLHLRIKLCSADAVECDVPSECLLELHTYYTAHQAVHMCVHPAQRTTLLYRRKDASLIDLLDDHRYRKHRSWLDDLHSLHQERRDRRFRQIIYGRACIHRIEHTESHLQGMGHRKYREPPVFLSPLAGMVTGDNIGSQIPMAQDDALCTSGGT